MTAALGVAAFAAAVAVAGPNAAPAANTPLAPAANTVLAPAANTTLAPAVNTALAPAVNTALAPAAVLVKYVAALTKSATPKALSFEYAVSQLGLRNMEQAHRVYRSGLSERDETLVVDGVELKAPAVRIISNRGNRYDVRAVAPKPARYTFAFAGLARLGDAPAYVFRTTPRTPAAFFVDEIVVDGRSFLPALVRFRVGSGGARGGGALLYGRAERYWVVRSAEVSATLRDGSTAHEKIVWSKYQFPDRLPASTFDAPRILPRLHGQPLPEPAPLDAAAPADAAPLDAGPPPDAAPPAPDPQGP